MSRRKTEKRSHSASAKKMRDEALLSSSYSAQLHLLQRAERPQCFVTYYLLNNLQSDFNAGFSIFFRRSFSR